VDLYNEGSETVTITHVGPSVPYLFTPSRQQWAISAQIAKPYGDLPLTGWHTITLGPHENVITKVTVHMTGGLASGGWEVFGDTPVTYTGSGATVHATVPMDFSVKMKGTRTSNRPG
jgi:hypothetical protein